MTSRQTLVVAVMLFGMFFGAGNLIFPAFMGWQSGSNMWIASLGFLITGVGLPLLGIASIGLTKSNGLFDLSSKVGRGYAFFFTCALYLTIGPFFAIPRCASTSFSSGVSALIGDNVPVWALPLFSFLFFAAVLAFSLKPSKIITWVGRILTPVFLVFLCSLVIAVILNPNTAVSEVAPQGAYAESPFMTGFLEGYNTMDALASLAFGIVVVNVIRSLGIEKPEAVAKSTARAGIFSCLIMAIIYLAVTMAGAMSFSSGVSGENGGDVLTYAAKQQFGDAGLWIIAITVTLACLKTSVGLVTSCSETFRAIFPKGPSYKVWAISFSAVSFLIANVGLTAIIGYSIPVLMFLYPLSITLILLGLFSKCFGNCRAVYISVTSFTLFAAIFDFVKSLPETVITSLHLNSLISFAEKVFPLYNAGLGWLLPAGIGLVIGLVFCFASKKKQGSAK